MAEEKQAGQQSASSFKHIVRIANVDIPGNKAIRVSLTKIKGIGINMAAALLRLTGVDANQKTGDLSAADISKLDELVKNISGSNLPVWYFNRRKDYETGDNQHLLTGTLNFVKDNDLKRLKKIKTLRGMRHQRKLPVRGQRTRSNFRKSKGKVVGVRKKGTPGKK
jgi:small subunit ribosomal protein S13